MKPFDGGGWRGVSRINDRGDLHRAYDESGEMLMHLQATVDYEHFARALSIGPETMVMDFRPDQPMHQRYAVNHGFLSESAGQQTVAISRIVNAFFRWEFNSCEMLVAGDEVYPIDYANACPDVAVTSLHYYFPWAITALVRWSTYCVVTGRTANVDLQTRRYFDDRRRPRRSSYDEKLDRLPRPRRRALRDRALLGLVRRAPRRTSTRRCSSGSPSDDVRPAAARHRAGDLPAPRAGGVPRPLPRPARPVGERAGRRRSRRLADLSRRLRFAVARAVRQAEAPDAAREEDAWV